MAELKRLGNLGGYSGGSFGGQVYGQDGLAPTINTAGGGDREPHIVEINPEGIANTLTTVQKDKKRKSARRRRDMSDSDNGEFP